MDAWVTVVAGFLGVLVGSSLPLIGTALEARRQERRLDIARERDLVDRGTARRAELRAQVRKSFAAGARACVRWADAQHEPDKLRRQAEAISELQLAAADLSAAAETLADEIGTYEATNAAGLVSHRAMEVAAAQIPGPPRIAQWDGRYTPYELQDDSVSVHIETLLNCSRQ